MSAAALESAGTTPSRKPFNWADEGSDSDSSDCEAQDVNANCKTPKQTIATEGNTAAMMDSETVALKELLMTTAALNNGVGGDSPAAMASSSTPSKQCQEVTIRAGIHYTLKSVWNGNGGGCSPAAAAAGSETSPNAARPATLGSETESPASLSRPIRMNRALDELTSVLRASNGSLPYDELMNRSQWRSRFQPSFGSLFTFLKRNRDLFRYQQSIVELVQESSVVTELLKMNWASGTSTAVEVNSRICGYGADGASNNAGNARATSADGSSSSSPATAAESNVVARPSKSRSPR